MALFSGDPKHQVVEDDSRHDSEGEYRNGSGLDRGVAAPELLTIERWAGRLCSL